MSTPLMTPLDQITVPTVKADEVYRTRVIGQSFSFTGLKALLGSAGFHTSGDQVTRWQGWPPLMKLAGKPPAPFYLT